MKTLKEAIEDYIYDNGDMSFAELHNRKDLFGKFDITGDMALTNDKLNIVYWAGLSELACNVINELIKSGYKLKPTSILIYFADGMTLKFPRAIKPPRNGYRELHWLPVIIIKTGARG